MKQLERYLRAEDALSRGRLVWKGSGRYACLPEKRLPNIELLTLTKRAYVVFVLRGWGFHHAETMKDIIKIAVFAILALALAPFAGFWIVALIGGGLILLPIGAAISTFFPQAWRHIKDGLFAKTRFLPTA